MANGQSLKSKRPASNEILITINTNDKKQTIQNFGASDAWVGNFVGQWPEEKKNKVADWLFSTEMGPNGQPLGIGLSLWRFNIGAGSATQNNIEDEWRRTEGFLNTDGSTYNWNKQAGQKWFLKAAKNHGVQNFVGFTNSPPIQFTKNGKGFSSEKDNANIDSTKYSNFANFLTDVIKHFKNEEGVNFNYLSPFNEPQWDWTNNSQEGSPYTNEQIFDITKKINEILVSEGLDTKIQLAEAGKINYLFESSDKAPRGNQIEDFFSPKSPHYLGNLPKVDKIISAHSYFSTMPIKEMISSRQKIKNKIQQVDKSIQYWQSEYCILGDQEEVNGDKKDVGIDPALYVARLIHFDLTEANASAWHWWLAFSVYDYKDGLIYVDKNIKDGNITDTKLLWALGNFSRFIRPGSVRLNVQSMGNNISDPKGLMVSSYLNQNERKLISVLINYSTEVKKIKLNIDNLKIKEFNPYITSSVPGEQLKPLKILKSTETISIPCRSVITIVGNF